jgi:hypothetical protein
MNVLKRSPLHCVIEARSSVVVCGIMLQAGMSLVGDPVRSINFFSIYLILPTALGPGDYSVSKRNEYQKQKKYSWEVERGRCVRVTK